MLCQRLIKELVQLSSEASSIEHQAT